MKVGLVTTGFPRFEGDHSGSFLLTLAQALVANGHAVRVLAPQPREARAEPRWPGIEVSWIPYLRPRRWQQTFYGSGVPDNLRLRPSGWAGALSFTAALRIAARRRLADCDALVSSWCIPSGWAASRVAEGRIHLCICHATDVRWLLRMPGSRTLARQIAKGATTMWFLSTADRERFFEAGRLCSTAVPVHVGPMPVEVPPNMQVERCELRRRLQIDRYTLLFLGRLVPVKGVRDLLFAVASMPDVSVRVAGDGPERAALQALANQLGVNAVFEGWVAGERKEALLRACDALVVPSCQTDGLPTVLFEARARGLPVVATRAGAIADALQGVADAVLVSPGDRAALRRAIEALRDREKAVEALRV
ncbi:MAG: glycosyltransferase family 4 protein [Polyangiales bacterium]